MKTNSAARRIVRLRVVAICMAIGVVAGMEFWLGESLAARMGQTTARLTDSPPAQNVSISDLMAAAR